MKYNLSFNHWTTRSNSWRAPLCSALVLVIMHSSLVSLSALSGTVIGSAKSSTAGGFMVTSPGGTRSQGFGLIGEWHEGQRIDQEFTEPAQFDVTIEKTGGATLTGLQLQIGVPSCFDVFIDGNQTANYFISPFSGTFHTFAVEIRAKTNLFTYDRYTLPPDGQSKATPFKNDPNAGSFTWSIVTGTNFASIDSSSGVVTAKTNIGTVVVQASSGSQCYQDSIQIEDCDSSCQGNFCASTAGGVSPQIASVDVKIGLGWAASRNTAGYLQIKEAQPSDLLATPQKLQYNFLRPGVDKTTENGALRQLKVPDCLVNIVTNTSYKYMIQFFNLTNVTFGSGATTPYLTNLTFAAGIVVTNLSETSKGRRLFTSFADAHPKARGFLDAYLPGYSKDGTGAVVRAGVGPWAHAAMLTAVLEKRGDKWTVVWYYVARFA